MYLFLKSFEGVDIILDCVGASHFSNNLVKSVLQSCWSSWIGSSKDGLSLGHLWLNVWSSAYSSWGPNALPSYELNLNSYAKASLAPFLRKRIQVNLVVLWFATSRTAVVNHSSQSICWLQSRGSLVWEMSLFEYILSACWIVYSKRAALFCTSL